MSYLHCPICSRAYNVATQPACPHCPVATTVVDPAADIVSAADQLARAVARATASERATALARLDQLALPAPDRVATTVHGGVVRSIRAALAPPAPPPQILRRPLLATVISLVDRMTPRLPSPLRRAVTTIRALAA